MDKFPINNPGQRITATTSNVFTQFTAGDMRNRAAVSSQILIANVGANVVHVISGSSASAPTATNACMPLAPGEKRVFDKPTSHDGVALLAITGSSDVIVFHGSGD